MLAFTLPAKHRGAKVDGEACVMAPDKNAQNALHACRGMLNGRTGPIGNIFGNIRPPGQV